MKIKFNKIIKIKGFTLVEMVVSIGIFALMTSLLMTKYGNFNQGVLLTNLAYDVALTIRNAQSYGLNVKSSARNSNDFNTPFGVHFTTTANTSFVFFSDLGATGIYDSGDVAISTSTIKRGSKINSLCVGSGNTCTVNNLTSLDITFKRPEPDAIITANAVATKYNYAEIWLVASDGSLKKVIVRSVGQIAVTN